MKINQKEIKDALHSADRNLLLELTAHYLELDYQGENVSIVSGCQLRADQFDFDFVNANDFPMSFNEDQEVVVYHSLNNDQIELEVISDDEYRKLIDKNLQVFEKFFNDREQLDDFLGYVPTLIEANPKVNDLIEKSLKQTSAQHR